MSAMYGGLFGGFVCAVAAVWIAYALCVARAAVPVVLVKGIDGRTHEVALDELEQRLHGRS